MEITIIEEAAAIQEALKPLGFKIIGYKDANRELVMSLEREWSNGRLAEHTANIANMFQAYIAASGVNNPDNGFQSVE